MTCLSQTSKFAPGNCYCVIGEMVVDADSQDYYWLLFLIRFCFVLLAIAYYLLFNFRHVFIFSANTIRVLSASV